jgi:hypothetical protein
MQKKGDQIKIDFSLLPHVMLQQVALCCDGVGCCIAKCSFLTAMHKNEERLGL